MPCTYLIFLIQHLIGFILITEKNQDYIQIDLCKYAFDFYLLNQYITRDAVLRNTDIFCTTVKTFSIWQQGMWCNHNNRIGVFCSASIHILELLCSFSCNLSAYTVNSHFFDSGVYSWLSFSTNQMVCQQENPWMT